MNKIGPAEIRTRVAGFKVQSDNRYTTGPHLANLYILYFGFRSSYQHRIVLFNLCIFM